MISFTLPIKTISEANTSEHWTSRAKRRKQQHFFIKLAFDRALHAFGFSSIPFPCTVKICRLSSRELDDDNLRSALKAIRDQLSECLIPESAGTYVSKNGKIKKMMGRADSDPRITWRYDQKKHASPQAVEIQIVF